MSTPKIVIKSSKVIDKNLSSTDLVSLLLKNRQISPTSDFLNPQFPEKPKDIHITSAVKLIKQSIADNDNILIYGDYDVDGITSTAILWQSLYQAKAKVTPFIPDRQLDGYGFKAKSFLRFQKSLSQKFSLLITVDNGIVAHSEIAKIKKLGLKIIILDHHLPQASLPVADSIIHSTKVAACALVWYLAKIFDKNADLGLVALGTVADCLPLIGPNRNLVVHGLKALRLNPSPGIKKLIEISGLKLDSVTAYDLGFALGPRINAVGRLSNPTDALRLLCSQTPAQAQKYAQVLDNYNQDRQILQRESQVLAESQVDLENKLLFVSDPSFHPGVIGLIAGRLVEKYYLPTIAISIDDDTAKGSCRSIPGLNIIETLRELDPKIFIDLGGHAGAAGFSILTKNIKALKTALTKLINKKLKDVDLTPAIEVDAAMKLSAVNLKNIKAISELEPFGLGNPHPLFLFKNVRVVSKRILGSAGDHLKLKLDDPSTSKIENLPADAIAFKKGQLDSQIKIDDLIDLIASLDANTWQGTTTPQLIVKEIIQHTV
ncbi:MAG: single-stranded-DNA-specific exonuclease RecJ [Candidatus Shapirobacteria bacterium]